MEEGKCPQNITTAATSTLQRPALGRGKKKFTKMIDPELDDALIMLLVKGLIRPAD